MKTQIDIAFENATELLDYLKKEKQLSYLTDAEQNFRKTLTISVASYYEKTITDLLITFINLKSNGDIKAISLVKAKAINYQYHTLFDWKNQSANSFFALFGDAYKKEMSNLKSTDNNFAEALNSFLDLGLERNKIVHQNFASYYSDKTIEEIYTSYKKANYFIEKITQTLLS